MYEELKRDLEGQYAGHPRKKAPQWGAAIKGLIEEKQARGEALSIPSLAKKTGIHDKHLFNIVAQRIQDPSSDKLVKIAEALGISFGELATRALGAYEGNFFVTGFGQRGYIEYSQHGFAIQSLSPPGLTDRDFFMGIMTIKPFKEMKKWRFKENSTVCLFLESGTLELTYGNKVRKIHSNESVYFDGGVPHKLRNVDSIEARLILVTRPPLH
ncbi:MAG: helix-turn-helix transcriptional regulator [Candidatus Omnitrophica bacterium]|nr:helix-turn-helix transcriptional regulator [Candidatus Omnitrophota bacterium]